MKSIYSPIRIFALICASFTTFAAFSQQVTYEQALTTASDFFKSKGVNAEISTMHRAKGTADNTEGCSPYYVINADNAFAIVAGDNRVSPILAYSLDGTFDFADVPDGAAYMLKMYEDYITALANGAEVPQSRSLPEISQGKELPTATWNQGWEPWWDQCPELSGRHCYAGCGATAMSIIMRYHNWPRTTGYGSKTYTSKTHNFVCTADFSNTDYKISTIPLTADEVEGGTAEQKDAIATLLYHAGVAASMDYDLDGSGTSDMNAFTGICKYFGYSYGARAVRSDYESDDEYLLEIVNEINEGRPMLYSGQSEAGGGHMFVCDGYDEDYKLHFNFGWSGSRNGFYSITDVSMTYYKWQQAIFGIRPNPDAATAVHPSLYFAESGNRYPAVVINARAGNGFNVGVNRVYNMTEGDINGMCLSLKICDSGGTPLYSLFNWDNISLNYNWYWDLSPNTYLPSEYTYTPGDRIMLFYSEDNKNTWRTVERYKYDNYLDMAVLCDETYSALKLYNADGNCPGLHLVSGHSMNTNGTAFKVCPDNIYNYTYVGFDGDVAIFLCDSQDQPKKMISSPQALTLACNFYKENFNIPCTLLPEYNIKSGDRLVAFYRHKGQEEWHLIPCDEPDRYYISIPESLVPTAQTVAFNGLFSAFSSCYDLDFSSISGFAAYTVSMQDSETLLLNRIDNVPSGEGVLLMGGNGAAAYSGSAAILSATPSAPDANLLIGVLEATEINNDDDSATNYVFKTSPDIGFYQASGETVAAGTAYMRIARPASGAPARFVFAGGDSQNGIISVYADDYIDTTIYNLQGIKVTKPGPGIYIMGGKKVIIR